MIIKCDKGSNPALTARWSIKKEQKPVNLPFAGFFFCGRSSKGVKMLKRKGANSGHIHLSHFVSLF
jgi:hypothetical protein